jgi:hypothetical protein
MGKRKQSTTRDQKFACPNSSCGIVFSKPLRVRNLSLANSEFYNACPHCFTEIIIEEKGLTMEAKPTAHVEETKVEEIVCVHEERKIEPSTGTQCAHHFGYLSERLKNEKISEECMVCENIVKCMLKAVNG